jgi:hypothetical protein
MQVRVLQRSTQWLLRAVTAAAAAGRPAGDVSMYDSEQPTTVSARQCTYRGVGCVQQPRAMLLALRMPGGPKHDHQDHMLCKNVA